VTVAAIFLPDMCDTTSECDASIIGLPQIIADACSSHSTTQASVHTTPAIVPESCNATSQAAAVIYAPIQVRTDPSSSTSTTRASVTFVPLIPVLIRSRNRAAASILSRNRAAAKILFRSVT
jgi:hypothetical protein